jgi:NitT/TauT family transport system substrate-binding protein
LKAINFGSDDETSVAAGGRNIDDAAQRMGMVIVKRLLPAIAACIGILFSDALLAEPAAVRVGVLKFGTVNWELDTIRHHGLDKANNVAIAITELAGKDGTAVALQGGSVDVIVTDWLWVSRRRAEGADFTFVPHSKAVGGVMVRPDSGIMSLADLKGKKLGVAGGPTDKSWIMLRAYAQKALGIDLAKQIEPVYGAPPLLNAILLKGDIPAALNFWNYEARLRAAGMRELIEVKDMLPALGLTEAPPIIGWVFSERWAAGHADAIDGFLKASRAAKHLLATSDAEWQRILPLTQAEDDATLLQLRDGYRRGIIVAYGPSQSASAEALMPLLYEFGGADLVGPNPYLAPGTFWSGVSN